MVVLPYSSSKQVKRRKTLPFNRRHIFGENVKLSEELLNLDERCQVSRIYLRAVV